MALTGREMRPCWPQKVAVCILGINNIDHSRKKIELNIGYQSITAQTWGALIIKNTHMLENKLKKYYPDREIVVNWYDEVSGSVINNNMIAHKYQIGFMGVNALLGCHDPALSC